jgi:glycosyltransferase involved in cell wall biosynthesis
MRRIFIVVPSAVPTGPIKGAYALANSLAGRREVTLVTVKKRSGAPGRLDPRVERICLADEAPSFSERVRRYRRMLSAAGGRARVASISMCFSADVLNGLCSDDAVICSSVRSNLIVNYRMDYGWPGIVLGASHLFGLRRFDHIVAMTPQMARQIRTFSGSEPAVIGNFVDEAALSPYKRETVREGPLRFAFVGSLTRRKRPWLVLDALAALRAAGEAVSLDVIGAGPLLPLMQEEVKRLALEDAVRLHGFVDVPYDLLSRADAMVLPSLSEGVPRAALEALYLGVPCVLRDADGNAELIRENDNGALFKAEGELAEAMLRAAQISRRSGARPRAALLPPQFRQETAASLYLQLVEKQ